MRFSSIFQLVANVLIHHNCLFVEIDSVMSRLAALVLDLEAKHLCCLLVELIRGMNPVRLACESPRLLVGSRYSNGCVCECRQKVLIPKTKPYITFQCSGRKTILVWGDTAAKAGGTSKSASTAIEADHFIATDCTFSVMHTHTHSHLQSLNTFTKCCCPTLDPTCCHPQDGGLYSSIVKDLDECRS